jgi:hypothetical protein
MTSNRWVLFGWPFSEDRFESSGESGLQGWEFADQGARGGANWKNADRMFIEYQDVSYLLYLGNDSRWHVQNSTTIPVVAFESGRAYYYFGTGTGFVWRAKHAP